MENNISMRSNNMASLNQLSKPLLFFTNFITKYVKWYIRIFSLLSEHFYFINFTK